jgi:mRNA-degrading endonuclease RelE of RelBE toxin-antitoxin system
MTWTIHIAKQAEKQLAKAPAKSRRLLLAALAAEPSKPVVAPNAPREAPSAAAQNWRGSTSRLINEAYKRNDV